MKRHNDAIHIVSGACNPSAIAHSIVEACQEIRAQANHQGTAEITSDPAVRLMVYQLAYICQVSQLDGPDEFDKAMNECERIRRA